MSCGHARRGRVRARCRMDTNARHRLAARALGQGGLLTALDVAELAAGGVNLRREVRAGRWRLVLPGVVVAASTPVDRELLTRAAVLWLPPYGALSHASAARCWGIHVPDDAGVWVTVPWEAPQRSRLGVTVVRTRHLPARWRTGRELRWTPADRTIVDLAQVLSARELDAALLSAVRRGVSSAVEIDRTAMGLHGRAGLQLLRHTTSRRTAERESQLEDLLDADVRSVYSGEVKRQVMVPDAAGRPVARLDIAAPELRLAFEADGLLFQSTDAQLATDQRRDRALLARGWTVVRFREGPLDDRSAVRADLAAILARRRRDVA